MDIKDIEINKITNLAINAGKKVLESFRKAEDPAQTTIKQAEEDTHVIEAGRGAYQTIVEGLNDLGYNFPILSEEKGAVDYNKRKDWHTYWVIDPLDGIKEFIERHEDFAISIALIHGHYPVLGVIYVPSPDMLYFAFDGEAFMCTYNHSPRLLTLPEKGDLNNLTAVTGRNYSDPEIDNVLSRLKVQEVRKIGSSLKFCMVAEGHADIFYRHGDIMEWDTAAGQAIVEMSGGKVLDQYNKRLSYNKPSLLENEFICLGFQKPVPDWHADNE